jgi:hypothetical protein
MTLQPSHDRVLITIEEQEMNPSARVPDRPTSSWVRDLTSSWEPNGKCLEMSILLRGPLT